MAGHDLLRPRREPARDLRRPLRATPCRRWTTSPSRVANPGITPSGSRTVPGSGADRLITNLWPYPSGYQVWVGGCLDADPQYTGASASCRSPPTRVRSRRPTLVLGPVDLTDGRRNKDYVAKHAATTAARRAPPSPWAGPTARATSRPACPSARGRSSAPTATARPAPSRSATSSVPSSRRCSHERRQPPSVGAALVRGVGAAERRRLQPGRDHRGHPVMTILLLIVGTTAVTSTRAAGRCRCGSTTRPRPSSGSQPRARCCAPPCSPSSSTTGLHQLHRAPRIVRATSDGRDLLRQPRPHRAGPQPGHAPSGPGPGGAGHQLCSSAGSRTRSVSPTAATCSATRRPPAAASTPTSWPAR